MLSSSLSFWIPFTLTGRVTGAVAVRSSRADNKFWPLLLTINSKAFNRWNERDSGFLGSLESRSGKWSFHRVAYGFVSQFWSLEAGLGKVRNVTFLNLMKISVLSPADPRNWPRSMSHFSKPKLEASQHWNKQCGPVLKMPRSEMNIKLFRDLNKVSVDRWYLRFCDQKEWSQLLSATQSFREYVSTNARKKEKRVPEVQSHSETLNYMTCGNFEESLTFCVPTQ